MCAQPTGGHNNSREKTLAIHDDTRPKSARHMIRTSFNAPPPPNCARSSTCLTQHNTDAGASPPLHRHLPRHTQLNDAPSITPKANTCRMTHSPMLCMPPADHADPHIPRPPAVRAIAPWVPTHSHQRLQGVPCSTGSTVSIACKPPPCWPHAPSQAQTHAPTCAVRQQRRHLASHRVGADARHIPKWNNGFH